MRNNLTEVVFILDRSGSMSGLEKDTIGGFNSMLSEQKREVGDAIVTTVIFDNEHEILHDRVKIEDVSPMTDKEYFARGTTALLDAIGHTIKRISEKHKKLTDDKIPDKVVFIITTDGQENASITYSYDKIKKMIEKKKSKKGWEFIFLGANIDSITEAKKLGISISNTANFHANTVGVANVFTSMSTAVSSYRKTDVLGKGWANLLGNDFKRRK